MATALTLAALATVLAGVVAVGDGLHHVEGASVVEVLGLSAMYAALYGSSAMLFRRAAKAGPPA